MTEKEKEKQAQIGRQAMNIQVMELVFKRTDSYWKPIEGLERTVMALYNLENISADEVEDLARSGMYEYDDRILLTDPERLRRIFPHRGESKQADESNVYWKPRTNANDFANCECSGCGFILPAEQAVKFGSSSTDYKDVIYRFCPKCGSIMSHKSKIDES